MCGCVYNRREDYGPLEGALEAHGLVWEFKGHPRTLTHHALGSTSGQIWRCWGGLEELGLSCEQLSHLTLDLQCWVHLRPICLQAQTLTIL